MNYTPQLTAFQGALSSADNVHQFARLSAKGGNEDAIDYVVDSLSKFLEKNGYITNGQISSTAISDVRRFAFYIVLNADLPALEQLVELCALIWITPTIPTCLMCEIMWNSHMEQFIFEIISYTNPRLALEVASAFLENFKYFQPLDCLEQLQQLSSACYILICRLHLFNFQTTEVEQISLAAFNNMQQCLKYYTTPPNNYKLNELGKVELYKYQGKALYSLLQLIDECLTQFTSKLEENPAGFNIYKLTFPEESFKTDLPTFNICESSDNILLESLNNANLQILETCKVLVMDISVDVFCCWSEFEENYKTMQQTVGELCYEVRNRLLNITTLADHPIVSMLEQISRKPIEMRDKINATEDNVIIQNINENNEESKVWIHALIYKDKLCQNPELLSIVHSNIDVYNEDESYMLFSIFKKHLTSDLENKDCMETLMVKVFEKCGLSKKHDILEEHFCNKVFIDMQETPEFTSSITSIFNKLIATLDSDFNDVLTVFFQNPFKVYAKIFSLATENNQQMEIMLKLMKLLDKFSDHYYCTETEPCIIQVTQKTFEAIETDTEQNNFINFVCGLKNENIIPGTKLLLLIIMTNIHKALLVKNITSLNVQLKLLNEAYELEELMEYRAPMLAMLAQVLNVARWKITTFSPNAPATLTLAINLQTSLLETFEGVIPEHQSQWLKSKLSNLQPLNMYYYRTLWDPPGSNYLETVSGMVITRATSMIDLTSFLSQIICSCTQQEWCELWDSLEAFESGMILNILHASIAMVTVAEKSSRNENSWACILHCYRNFLFITRYKYLTDPLTSAQMQSILNKAAMIAELVKDENFDEFVAALLPLFAYLTEKQTAVNMDFMDYVNDTLANTKLSPVINEVFVNGTA